ncbi:hypothetical protein V6N13_000888 [Hibiscus sabdariffa]|uniref:acid phosphatase n=1 Tax=Hibiscus sabdariffa TaxID=183260 RepID=A0ABR2G7K3_9ROSI
MFDPEKTPWLIILMHVPIYNSNDVHFMEGESMRAVFEKWFIRHKVDIVFVGHVHAYERPDPVNVEDGSGHMEVLRPS